jgi:hypothetical protein
MDRDTFVYAIFRDEKRAVRAVRGLIDAAFPTRDINALLSGRANSRSDTKMLEPAHHTGIQRGAMLGAVLGVGGGALVASGGLLIAGPLFLGLQGVAIAGGALGSLLGALAGLAHWNDEIEFPANAFERGGVLVGVTTHEARAGEALQILLAAGGRRARVSTKREARQVAREYGHASAGQPDQSKAAH